jgi:hypothetical protein
VASQALAVAWTFLRFAYLLNVLAIVAEFARSISS